MKRAEIHREKEKRLNIYDFEPEHQEANID